ATKIAIRPKYRAGSAITNGQAGAPFATKRTAIARYAATPTPLISQSESAVHIEPIVLRTPRRRGTRLIERNALRAFRPQPLAIRSKVRRAGRSVDADATTRVSPRRRQPRGEASFGSD